MAIYNKDLSEQVRLRLSVSDMDFLRKISEERNVTVSECIRSIIGEYRRSLQTMEIFNKALTAYRKGEQLSYGDTESNKHNIV